MKETKHSRKNRPYTRLMVGFLMFFYCVAIFLLLDLIYSNLIFYDAHKSARVRNALYDHDLTKNFFGYDNWGGYYYSLYTNSLGFKDGSARIVPLVGEYRRVLLMGDSFTEGIGLPFDQTFAGLLYRAGLQNAKKIEILNAALSGYSPVIYYKKIKYLLESGLHFDEVVVFSDLSDVADEATNYFCVDDDPRYYFYCRAAVEPIAADRTPLNFIMTERIRQIIKRAIQSWYRPTAPSSISMAITESMANTEMIGDWTLPDFKRSLLPLGVEGGIARSLQNMQKLADLLAEHNIPLTIAVYPWPKQLLYNDRDSRQIAIWRAFCIENCKEFINLFPAFFAEKDAHEDWYKRLFIYRDVHFSGEGHKLVFRELTKHLP